MKIVIISGTAREGRNSHQVAEVIHKKLKKVGETPTLVDVKEYNLPLLEYKYDQHPSPSSEMERLHVIFDEADAFILVSPEYNGSYTGALKNTMDHFYPEYAKKVIGVCSVSAGGMNGIRGALSLQRQVLNYGGFPLPKMLTVGSVHTHFKDGELDSPQLSDQIDSYLSEFLWLAEAVYSKKST